MNEHTSPLVVERQVLTSLVHVVGFFGRRQPLVLSDHSHLFLLRLPGLLFLDRAEHSDDTQRVRMESLRRIGLLLRLHPALHNQVRVLVVHIGLLLNAQSLEFPLHQLAVRADLVVVDLRQQVAVHDAVGVYVFFLCLALLLHLHVLPLLRGHLQVLPSLGDFVVVHLLIGGILAMRTDLASLECLLVVEAINVLLGLLADPFLLHLLHEIVSSLLLRPLLALFVDRLALELGHGARTELVVGERDERGRVLLRVAKAILAPLLFSQVGH
mmetsp:Transcript_90605/g.230541  ORF Transcript_90605/g.230541 Transcript_90605/m.230541 type:complete len:270 (+) Transcript_90605:312-1121(+)